MKNKVSWRKKFGNVACTCHHIVVLLTYLKVETGSEYPGNGNRVPVSYKKLSYC